MQYLSNASLAREWFAPQADWVGHFRASSVLAARVPERAALEAMACTASRLGWTFSCEQRPYCSRAVCATGRVHFMDRKQSRMIGADAAFGGISKVGVLQPAAAEPIPRGLRIGKMPAPVGRAFQHGMSKRIYST